MSIFKHYQEVISKFLIAAALAALNGMVIAQQDESTPVQEQTELAAVPQQQPTTDEIAGEPVITIEQITVTGQQTFFSLRAQIEGAKEALYSTYNDLNLDDELDVNCRQSDWTGTHIKEQVCWPVFFENAVSENSQDYLRGIAVLEPVAQLQSQYQGKFDELRANITKVANENPEVEDALMELGALEAAYEKKREECMQQNPLLLIFRVC